MNVESSSFNNCHRICLFETHATLLVQQALVAALLGSAATFLTKKLQISLECNKSCSRSPPTHKICAKLAHKSFVFVWSASQAQSCAQVGSAGCSAAEQRVCTCVWKAECSEDLAFPSELRRPLFLFSLFPFRFQVCSCASLCGKLRAPLTRPGNCRNRRAQSKALLSLCPAFSHLLLPLFCPQTSALLPEAQS